VVDLQKTFPIWLFGLKGLEITNLMGHNLVIIIVWNVFFVSSYGINTNFINLLMLFEHWYHAHFLDTNVICLFVLFKHGCCMFIHVVYIRKLYTRLLRLNNPQHSCLTNTNYEITNFAHIWNEPMKLVNLWWVNPKWGAVWRWGI
jgi:hypothetical protein